MDGLNKGILTQSVYIFLDMAEAEHFVHFLCGFKMSKFLFFCFFSFVLIAACFSAGNKQMELDTYVNMSFSQVIEILGKPDFVSEKTIDKNYLPTPSEPPYFVFFPDEELEKGITITIAKWVVDKGKTEILAWLKENNGELIVFTSQKSSSNKKMI